MDWDLAINRNREALLRLLTRLVVSVERVSAGAVGVLPRFVRANVLRSLRPAESALRRLIFVTAHLLVVAGFSATVRAFAPRPFPKGGIPRGGEPRSPAFPLYDPQKCFEVRRRKYARHCPRIFFFDDSDPAFEPVVTPPVPLPDDLVDSARLLGRLAAMKLAVEDVPKLAKRLLRVQARREQNPPGPGRLGPLRSGFPPGHNSGPARQIDEVLRQCDWLARRVVEPADTS